MLYVQATFNLSKKMSVAPASESLKEERERLVDHVPTLQSRIREIDLELDGGEGGGKGAKNPTAGETSPSNTPLRNSRPSIQAKAKSLVDSSW